MVTAVWHAQGEATAKQDRVVAVGGGELGELAKLKHVTLGGEIEITNLFKKIAKHFCIVAFPTYDMPSQSNI